MKEIEEKRQLSMKRIAGYKRRTILLFALYIAILPFLISITNINFLGLFIIIGLVIQVFSYDVPYDEEKKVILTEIKEDLIREVIRFLDRSLCYEPTNTIPKDVFLQANLFRTAHVDTYKGEDYIYGKIGETSIAFSEIYTEREKEDYRGGTKMVTLFKGLFFEIDFHKSFTGTIYVTRNTGGLPSVFGGNKPNNNQERLEEVVLENAQFQARYMVRASDQVLARYVLTPSFMERLCQFEDSTGANIRFSFREGKMYMAIETNKDHFDIELKKTLNQDTLYTYFQEVKIAFDLVEELNLNTTIWK